MSNIRLLLVLFLPLLMAGCAHSIQLNPDLETLRKNQGNNIAKNVGYYISAVDRVTEVETPGGGGDKVKYFPYKDTEGSLKTVLMSIFARVYSVSSLEDTAYIKDKNIQYIFIPEIKTDSSSSSAFTWPPTKFTVDLTCKAVSPDGKVLWKTTVAGQGEAKFSDFKSDFSISARRATQDAFTKLKSKIIDEQSFRQ